MQTWQCVKVLAMAALFAGAMAAAAQDSTAPKPSDATGEIVLESCRVKFIDQVVLASDRPGVIKFVEPREGDSVEKGTAIAGLRDEVPRAALEIAEHDATNDIEVRFAKKSSEVTKTEYDKAVETNRLATGAVPEVEILHLKLSAEKAKLQAEQAAHTFEKAKLTRDQARAELKSFQVEAPFTGIVTRVLKFPGEAVQQGDPILEVVNPERLRVEGFVDVADVRSVVPGQRVKVQLELPGSSPPLSPEVLEGKLVFVDVSVQPVGGKVRVWADVENRDGLLRAGQTARMAIERADSSRAASTAGERSSN